MVMDIVDFVRNPFIQIVYIFKNLLFIENVIFKFEVRKMVIFYV